MSDPTLLNEAVRLHNLAHDLVDRFDAWGKMIAPIGLPENIAAMRLILDHLEREMGPVAPTELAEYEKLAGEVNRDLPDESITVRLDEAMKRSSGSPHPLYLREALRRTPPAPNGGEE